MSTIFKKSFLMLALAMSFAPKAEACPGDDPITKALTVVPALTTMSTVYGVGNFMYNMHKRYEKLQRQKFEKEMKVKKIFKEIKDDGDNN